MKTLVIRSGEKHTIRAIATESEDVSRDKCEVLAFLQEHRIIWPEELSKLGAILSDTADNGPPKDEKKFKRLKGTDGLYEFKSPQGLRLFCFWDDGGLIVCTHGYVKDGQKAPKNEIDQATKLKRYYFLAKQQNTLTHVESKKEPLESFDSFEGFFDQIEKRDSYWEERAKLEFTREVLDVMNRRGISRSRLASLLGVRPGMVTRLLSGKNNFEMATMVRLGKALGCRFRSHLHLNEHNCMWVDVLKEEPVQNSINQWNPNNFKSIQAIRGNCEELNYVPIAVNP